MVGAFGYNLLCISSLIFLRFHLQSAYGSLHNLYSFPEFSYFHLVWSFLFPQFHHNLSKRRIQWQANNLDIKHCIRADRISCSLFEEWYNFHLNSYCSFLLPSTRFGDFYYLQTMDGHTTQNSSYHVSSKMKSINHIAIMFLPPNSSNWKQLKKYRLKSQQRSPL